MTKTIDQLRQDILKAEEHKQKETEALFGKGCKLEIKDGVKYINGITLKEFVKQQMTLIKEKYGEEKLNEMFKGLNTEQEEQLLTKLFIESQTI